MSFPRLAGVALAFAVIAVVASAVYYGSLSPRRIATDLDIGVLDALKRAGSDLSKPHAIDFYLYFPSKLAAQDAAAQLEKRGFAVMVADAATGPSWLCLAKKTLVPTPEIIRDVGGELTALADGLKGEYDGWEAAVTH